MFKHVQHAWSMRARPPAGAPLQAGVAPSWGSWGADSWEGTRKCTGVHQLQRMQKGAGQPQTPAGRTAHTGDPRRTLQRATRAAHVRGVHSQRGGQIGRCPSHVF